MRVEEYGMKIVEDKQGAERIGKNGMVRVRIFGGALMRRYVDGTKHGV